MGCCTSRDSDGAPAIVWYDEFEASLPSMSGKCIAITGTTSGTGLVAARACARKGAQVILLNRESERATAAFDLLKTECPLAKIHAVPCDLMDFASVRKAAQTVRSLCPSKGLDVVCWNAGVMAFPDTATKDGFDVQMQTNHLSHFLLTKELLPQLRKAAKATGEARIVSHSSGARFGPALDAKYFGKNSGDLGGDGVSACFDRYHQTKLANIVFTYALEAKLAASGDSKIRAVCCTPGIAATSLINNLESSGTSMGPMKVLFACLGPLMIQSQEDGTMPLLQGIAGKDVESADLLTPSAGGWRDPREAYGPVKVTRRPLPNPEKSGVCSDPSAQDVLWAESEKAIGETFKI